MSKRALKALPREPPLGMGLAPPWAETEERVSTPQQEGESKRQAGATLSLDVDGLGRYRRSNHRSPAPPTAAHMGALPSY
jgi:hypothetical protein